MKMSIKKQSIQDIILVLFAGVVLCFMGYVNYYPLFYPDCGTYIHSGFTLKVPVDRPIFYGLFVRHVSLLTSLWFVIWAQGILLALVVFYYFKYLSGTPRFRFYYLLYIFLITFFTAASFNVSQLLPDIFTPISILSLGLLIFAGKMKRRDIVITSIILMLSLAVHNSHLLINVLLLSICTIIFLIKWFRKELLVFNMKLKRIIYIWIVFLVTYLAVCTTHARLGGGFEYSRGGHVFLMSRLIDTGILNVYLQDNCNKYHFKICQYKDKMPWDFLWDGSNSPLYKYGDGWTDPKIKEEYMAIIKDVMTTPKYAHLFMVKSLEGTIKQFFWYGPGDAPVQQKDSPSYYVMNLHYPASVKEFLCARQQLDRLNLSPVAEIQKYLIALALFLCAGFLLFPGLGGKFKWVILFILTGLLVNAFICGTFALVDTRFQTRVVWLIPLPLILIMANREFFVATVQKLFRKNDSES